MRRLTVGLAVFLTSVICMAAPAFGKFPVMGFFVEEKHPVAPGGKTPHRGCSNPPGAAGDYNSCHIQNSL